MFGRQKPEPQDEQPVDPTAPDDTAKGGRKSGPTPKRSAQQANRQRPLVPTDRKVAKEQERQRRIEAQERLRLANETGDERYLMPRDKGPQRRFARDFIDSRWMFGEFMMFIVFGFLIFSLVFTNNIAVQTYAYVGLWVVLILVLLEAIITSFLLKRELVKRFGSVERGVRLYAGMRGLQFRKLRLPKPQVKRGAQLG